MQLVIPSFVPHVKIAVSTIVVVFLTVLCTLPIGLVFILLPVPVVLIAPALCSILFQDVLERRSGTRSALTTINVVIMLASLSLFVATCSRDQLFPTRIM